MRQYQLVLLVLASLGVAYTLTIAVIPNRDTVAQFYMTMILMVVFTLGVIFLQEWIDSFNNYSEWEDDEWFDWFERNNLHEFKGKEL